jgi:hypothetical protein
MEDYTITSCEWTMVAHQEVTHFIEMKQFFMGNSTKAMKECCDLIKKYCSIYFVEVPFIAQCDAEKNHERMIEKHKKV